MKSTFQSDRVIVEFTNDDWDHLMTLLGFATGIAIKDPAVLRMALRFVNAINLGNPSFTPYEERVGEATKLL
jgi:hypothetical protein